MGGLRLCLFIVPVSQRHRSVFFIFACLWSCLALATDAPSGSVRTPDPPIIQVELVGSIGPAASDMVRDSLDRAAALGSPLVILRIDTPGGLDAAMRDIVKAIIVSPTAVAVYVAPGGSRAASAGTYIVYASHIAAMAPATHLGAATPVRISMTGENSGPTPQDAGEPERPDHTSVMKRKLTNDAVAYIRGLAMLRGRNAQWAEDAVRRSVSLTAEDALRLNVIDLVATDRADLLRKLEGRSVQVAGRAISLNLRGARIETVEPDWRNRLLAAIADPDIAYFLMLIGIYGLLLEFAHPGSVVPGAIGAISLLFALYAFQALSINYSGVALILLGLGLMIAEAFVPSFGILGIGGMVAFVFGSILFVDTGIDAILVNPRLIAAFAIIGAVLCIVLTRLLLRARHRPIVSGREQLIGGVATALEDFQSEGSVRIHSETWHARTDQAVQKTQSVRVDGIDGLTLIVSPIQRDKGD